MKVDTTANTPKESAIAIQWFGVLLEKTKSEVDDLFSKYRLSEALMLIYKLYWDEFSAWYLEIVKPEYGKAIDVDTYYKTVGFFEDLLKLLHPFMPFITEELYHALQERNKGESIMTQSIKCSKASLKDDNLVVDFETVKGIIANIRTIRQQKNISPKESIMLYVKGEYNTNYDEVIKKLGNVSEIKAPSNSLEGGELFPSFGGVRGGSAVSFLVGTTEFSVPVAINVEEEIKKIEAEITYYEGFLKSVNAKLNNEKFIANARPEVIANERNKKEDAENKIQMLSMTNEALKITNYGNGLTGRDVAGHVSTND